MSEEEIIHKIQSISNSLYFQGFIKDNNGEISKCLNNFLDLYNKEKEEKEKFKKALGKRITYCNELEKDLFENCSNYVISKDKIREKIEELENSDTYGYVGEEWNDKEVVELLKELLEE